MRKILPLILLLALTTTLHAQTKPAIIPVKPTYPQFEQRTHKSKDGNETKYRLLIPKDYAPGKSLPLVIWLHGANEKGDDNNSPIGNIASSFLVDKAKCPAFVFVPQCPQGTSWFALGYNKPPAMTAPATMIIETIPELIKEFGIDDTRIYIAGFSMGSGGAWDLLIRYPDLFAAAALISGPPSGRPGMAGVVKDIPIWIFHGEKDRIAPVTLARETAAALKEAGSKAKFTEYPGKGHEVAQALNEPELKTWLFEQKRAKPAVFTQGKAPDNAFIIIKTIPQDTRGTWTGTVSRAENGGAQINIDKVSYCLRPTDKTDSAMADTFAKIAKKELTGDYEITGAVDLLDRPWIVVEKITPNKQIEK